MYKDQDKQRQANRQAKRKERAKGMTPQGETPEEIAQGMTKGMTNEGMTKGMTNEGMTKGMTNEGMTKGMTDAPCVTPSGVCEGIIPERTALNICELRAGLSRTSSTKGASL